MLRQIVLLTALLATLCPSVSAAIWPEEFFGYRRDSLAEKSPGPEPAWEELGFEAGEVAQYSLDGRRFTATAYRFDDATAAMAAFEWLRPVDARPTEVTELSLEWDDGAFLAFGNYVIRFDGFRPTEEQVVGQLLIVPMLEQSALPTWIGFVPTEGVVPGTQRFAIGPATLEEFEPRIPPSVAGFHFGVEVQLGEYESPKGNLRLAVFSYPTPHIARERLPEFRMIPGTVVKRTGPLLAVVIDPPDPDEAERLLGRINYRATITWDEYSFNSGPSIVDIVLTGFLFIGLLFLAAILLGALFGGFKFWKWRNNEAPENAMIVLHIEDK